MPPTLTIYLISINMNYALDDRTVNIVFTGPEKNRLKAVQKLGFTVSIALPFCTYFLVAILGQLR